MNGFPNPFEWIPKSLKLVWIPNSFEWIPKSLELVWIPDSTQQIFLHLDSGEINGFLMTWEIKDSLPAVSQKKKKKKKKIQKKKKNKK